jgi:aryl-alcohol dehydrogenase-like predicted oxidoreductase
MRETMRKRRLGRTGLTVGEVGLGGARLLGHSGGLPLAAGIATIRRALELGIDYIDTAECYIDGRSEAVVGAALDQVDASCVVATKLGHRPADFDFSCESVLASAQASMRLLGRPIDILQIHTPETPPWERLFGRGGAFVGLREARARGWCRFLGITGMDVAFLRRCIETDLFDTALIFYCYDLLDQSGAALLDLARAHDIGLIVGSPLRMGLFGTARDQVLPTLSPAQRRKLAALDTLFADEPGGIAAAALRFILASDAVGVVLAGADTPKHVEECVAAASLPLAPDLADAVRRIESG